MSGKRAGAGRPMDDGWLDRCLLQSVLELDRPSTISEIRTHGLIREAEGRCRERLDALVAVGRLDIGRWSGRLVWTITVDGVRSLDRPRVEL